MDVINKIRLVEINGKEVRPGEIADIEIRNHWNRDGLVVLVIGDERYTMRRSEVEAAMQNATNTAKYSRW